VLVLRKPLAGYLEARTQQIHEQLRDAAQKSARAEEQRQKAEELLQNLDSEVEKARAEAKRAAEAERERILTAADQEAKRIRELARKEIAAEVETGRRRLLARATELSVELAQKKLESTMTEKDQARLIDRSIEILGKTP
jgi:F-type H+-transporting ATPase subunit b